VPEGGGAGAVFTFSRRMGRVLGIKGGKGRTMMKEQQELCFLNLVKGGDPLRGMYSFHLGGGEKV